MIKSAHNQRLKAARLLLTGRGRDRASDRARRLLESDLGRAGVASNADLLILEGPNLVQAGIDSGLAMPLVLATETFVDACHPIMERLDPLLVEDSLLHQLADADAPRGLLAIAVAPPRSAIHELVSSRRSTIVYLDALSDPKNVGAILRVAEASGVDLVVLGTGSASWRHPRALRASAGSALRVPIAEDHSASVLWDALNGAQESDGLDEPWEWFGLAADGESLFDTPVPLRRVLVLGSESGGLSEPATQLCARRLAIPMSGSVESLNVATAAAVALFEIQRRAPLMTVAIP